MPIRIAIALTVCSLFGQTPAPAPSTPPKSPFIRGPFEFSGVVDGYFSHNGNSPDSKFNAVRNFDTQANRPALNMARLAISSAIHSQLLELPNRSTSRASI